MTRQLILTIVLAASLLIPAAGSASAQEAPQATGEPVVSGNTVQGQTLTTTNGTWSGSTPMTFQYRWLRCDASGGGANGVNCDTISGETRNTYVLTAADVGHTIRSRVIATNADGEASANSDPTGVVQASASAGPPANTAPPTISGTAQEGKTLTATQGSWQGDQPQTYTYQWRQCDQSGGACVNITGATGQTYVVRTADIGHTLRVIVTAHNSLGNASSTSTPTGVVVKASAPAGASISVNDVVLPNRLVVDRVLFSPFILRSKRPFVARFHVSDTQGHSVVGALVFVVGIPFGNTTTPAEQATGPGGYVTFVVRPTRHLHLSRHGSQPFFVRARKPSDRLIAGVSTRRLVNLSIRGR
jgi:hypothetical protein